MKQVIRGLLLALIISCLCAPSVLAFEHDPRLPDPHPFISVPSTSTPIPGDAGDVGWAEIETTNGVSPSGGGEQVIPVSTGAESNLAITLIKLMWNDLTEIVVTGASNQGF